MLSSHKAVRPQGLHSSSAKPVISSPCATSLHSIPPTTYRPSKPRDFSWGAKHKTGNKNAGKVWKGFSTQDHTRAQKQLYRGTFWNHHYTSHLRQYLPIQDWRLSSSWGKPGSAWVKPDETPTTKSKSGDTAEEDWYSRYQTQKKKQYDEFMKKMEEDPIGMLFGRKWANIFDGAEARFSQTSQSKAQEEHRNPKNRWSTWDFQEEPRTSKEKTSEGDKTSCHQEKHSRTVENGHQDCEIDPITNRKVHKLAAKPKESIRPEKSAPKKTIHETVSSVREIQQSSEIPVKRFVPPKTGPSSTQSPEKFSETPQENSSTLKPQATLDWLAQEGFGHKQESNIHKQPIPKIEAEKQKAANTKLESALDRHLHVKTPNVQSSDRATLQYKPKENTTEDVDLLRASDVRASAGLRGRSPKESDWEKQARKRKLEEEYDSGSLRREEQLAQVVEGAPQKPLNTHAAEAEEGDEETFKIVEQYKDDGSQAGCTKWVVETAKPSTAQGSTKAGIPTREVLTVKKVDKIKAQIVPLKTKLDAIKADYDTLRQRWLDEKRRKEEKGAERMKEEHEAEVKSQKAAMEAIEMRRIGDSSQKSSSAGHDSRHGTLNKPSPRLQSYLPGEGDVASNVYKFASRERWYKKKAPHASNEMDAKLQRLANDRALIREVRDIYEETYGAIDINHRQAALGGDTLKSSSASEVQIPTIADTSSKPLRAVCSSDSSTPPSPSSNTPPTLNPAADTPQNTFTTQSLDKASSSDPLATIQRLFDALRQAQTLVQDHRSSLQELSDPSESQLSSVSESSNALAIIQKLFSELRRAQTVVQNQRAVLEQLTDSNESATTMQASKAYNQSVKEIMKSAWNLATIKQNVPMGVLAKGLDATAKAANTAQLSDSPARSGLQSINGGSNDVKSLSTYRILAYDSTEQKVISSKATSIAPFSKEQRLLPVEALKVLNNPGKFLPDLMSLHNKGYTVVSGTGKTLVLKKPATPEEIEQAEHEEVLKDLNPVDGTLPHWADYLSPWCEGMSQPPFSPEEIRARVKARKEEAMGYPDSDPPAPPASASVGSNSPESPSAGSTSTDSADLASAAPSSESNLPPSDKVRREEAVFSGPSRGNWQEAESKRFNKKHKRAAKRSKRLKNMLWTGTLTAGCCYAVGVILQMLQH